MVYLTQRAGSGIVDRGQRLFPAAPRLTSIPAALPRHLHSVNLSEDYVGSIKDAIAAGRRGAEAHRPHDERQTTRRKRTAPESEAHYLRELRSLLRDVWQCCVLIIHHAADTATERPRARLQRAAGERGLHARSDPSETAMAKSDVRADAATINRRTPRSFKDRKPFPRHPRQGSGARRRRRDAVNARWRLESACGDDIRETLLKGKGRRPARIHEHPR